MGKPREEILKPSDILYAYVQARFDNQDIYYTFT